MSRTRTKSRPLGLRRQSIKPPMATAVALTVLPMLGGCPSGGSGTTVVSPCDQQLPTILAALRISEHTHSFDALEQESQRYFASDAEIIRQATQHDTSSIDAFLSTSYGLATFASDAEKFRTSFESMRHKWQQSSADRLGRTQFFTRNFDGVDKDVALAALKQYEDCRNYIRINSSVLDSTPDSTDFSLDLRYTLPGTTSDGEQFTISKVIFSSQLAIAPQDGRKLEGAAVTMAGIQRVIRLPRTAPTGWMIIEFNSVIPAERIFFQHTTPVPLVYADYSLHLTDVAEVGQGKIELGNTYLRSVMIEPLNEDPSISLPGPCELPLTSMSHVDAWKGKKLCTLRVGSVSGTADSIRANILVALSTDQDDIDDAHKGERDVKKRRAYESTLKGVDVLKLNTVNVGFDGHGTVRLDFELRRD